MAIGHDKFLVVLSVLIAVQASYVGLSLSSNVETSFGLQRRLLLGGAALSLAIGIWGMHFVGMLAAQLPTAVDYVVLPTLVSLFICVLVVGFAIFTASVQPRTVRSLAIAAFAMGVGIASMHYTGMRAIHASVHMNHASSFVVASFVVAIAASALAIWLAFGTTRRPPLLICAIVLGLAISGMHYTAMAGLSFHPNTAASTPSSPSIAISTELLAIVVAVVVFVVSGLFMLTLVPDSAHSRVPNLDLGRDTGAPKFQRSEVASHQIPASTTEIKSASTLAIPVPVAGQTLGEKVSLPVERHGVRISVPADEIFWIRANTHYTYVFDGRDSLFCPLSISQVEKELDPEDFIRVHRSHIVNVRRVTSLKRSGDNNGIIELAGAGRRMVPVSRNKMADLRAKLAPEKCSSNSV